ncbi:MAG: carbohydrate-binding protein, partial [Bacteroidales bacterium]|nr:carbohydrate-binding protein [Bacteroidales bacterium]
SVELINGEAGKYLSLTFKQTTEGLMVNLPEKSFQELAYVLKLSFDGKIPAPDKYADVNCAPYYYLIPGDNSGSLVLGHDLTLSGKRKDTANQWKLESLGRGYYKLLNRANSQKAIECVNSDHDPAISDLSGKDNQIWKIENSLNGLKISNKQFPNRILSVNNTITEGNRAAILNTDNSSFFGWRLKEVCEIKQSAYKTNSIPGTIEAENFDNGCSDDAYYDKDDINEGGAYRINSGVDIENCSSGGYNVGWTKAGEWLAYTVTIKKSAKYQVSFYMASTSNSTKAHLECDGANITGVMAFPNTGAYQKWEVVSRTIKLEAGEHILVFFVDGDGLNLDKMVFEEII